MNVQRGSRKITDTIKSVRIGPYVVAVIGLDLPVDRRGEADLQAAEIHIDTTQAFQVQRNTLMHEIVHFIRQYLLEGTAPNEESEIVALTNSIECLLLDNPKIAALYATKSPRKS